MTASRPQHDLRLVVLLAVIVALASFYGDQSAFHSMRLSIGQMPDIWLAVSATSTPDFRVWPNAFHRHAGVLGRDFRPPHIPCNHPPRCSANLLTGTGAWRSPSGRIVGRAPGLAGRWSGGGIAAMHYIGRAAFRIFRDGSLWDAALVVASIASGRTDGAIALPFGMRVVRAYEMGNCSRPPCF